jgi:hypothetical protein
MRQSVCFSIMLIFVSHIAIAEEPIDSMKKRIDDLEKRVSQLENELKGTPFEFKRIDLNPDNIRGTSPSVLESGGSVPDLSGTYSMDKDFVMCPPGTFVAAIQGFTRNGPLYALRYYCRKIVN